MKKVSLPCILDSLFVFFVTFSLSFVIFYTYAPKSVSLSLAITFALLSFLIAYSIFYERYGKHQLEKKEEILLNDVINQLSYNSKETNEVLIERAFVSLGVDYTKKENGLVINQGKYLLYPLFSFDQILKSDIIRAFNKIEQDEKIIILSNSFSDEIQEFCKKFMGKIILVTGVGVYNLLKKGHALPEITFKLSKPKITFKEIIKKVLCRKKAKNYFLYGFIFLIFSFFIPFKAYYIISGTLFMIFSVFVYFFTKEAKSNNLPF